MITTVRTRHSVYEVDLAAGRARRLSSDHAPTPNQERWRPDGEWLDFLSVSWCGGGLLFVWRVEDLPDGETVVRRTRTSPVTEVVGPLPDPGVWN